VTAAVASPRTASAFGLGPGFVGRLTAPSVGAEAGNWTATILDSGVIAELDRSSYPFHRPSLGAAGTSGCLAMVKLIQVAPPGS